MSKKQKPDPADAAETIKTTRFNGELDPDNAVSPLSFEERQRIGERYFYPEGDPEGRDLEEKSS